MKSTFAHVDFRRLFIGQAVSGFGDWMVTVALMALVLELSGSSAAVGGILLLRLLPAAAAGPIAGRLATRWDRRRTMLTSDLVRAVVVAMIPLVNGLWWVYVGAFLLEGAGIVFLPARDSLIPDLVDHDELPIANGLILGSSYGSIPVGAAAFAGVAAWTPTGSGYLGSHPFLFVFLVDAVSFIVSFAFVAKIETRGASAVATDAPPTRFADAFRIPLVRAVMGPTTAISLALGTLFSVGISYVRDVLHAGDVQFGFLIALFGLGAAGGLGVLVLLRHVDDLLKVGFGVIAQGATIAVMSLARTLLTAFIGAAAFGAATAIVLAAGMSALQTSLEGSDRILAFTAFHVVTRVALSASAIAAGVAADLISPVHVVVLGTMEPARIVLFAAGVAVVASAAALRRAPARSMVPTR